MFAKSKEEVPGLYHANAREYDSQSGRFLTRDHYRYMDYADPVSLNLYQYAKSNPLRYVDYDGHVCIEEPSYMERTWNCVVMGSYSDDVTVLGIIINVLLGLAGVDILADLRDLSADLTVNFAPQELSWWATTLIDVAALFPVIGALKHLDEVGVAVKGAVKSLDDMLSGVKYTDSMLEGIGEAIKTCRKNSEELLKKAQEALEASKKKLRSVKNSGEELVEDSVKAAEDITDAARQTQKSIIESVENSAEGTKGLTNLQKGNYGEMKMDDFYESQGYNRISTDRVTDLNESTHQGIDGVYYKEGPPPEYIVGESKYGTSKLSKELADGTNQMDDDWIAKRIEKAIGEDAYEKYLVDKVLYPDCEKDVLFHINIDCTVDEPIQLVDGIQQ